MFHHTYPHLNFTNPIYCYLYPWLLLSLLLLLLLLWLKWLSSRSIFSFYIHGFKFGFSELGGCLANKRQWESRPWKRGRKELERERKSKEAVTECYWDKNVLSCFVMPILWVCFPIVKKTCWKEKQLNNKCESVLLCCSWWQSFWAISEMWQVWLFTFDVCKYPTWEKL